MIDVLGLNTEFFIPLIFFISFRKLLGYQIKITEIILTSYIKVIVRVTFHTIALYLCFPWANFN